MISLLGCEWGILVFVVEGMIVGARNLISESLRSWFWDGYYLSKDVLIVLSC